MTLTRLSLEDVQHSADLRAKMEALWASSKPQKFTAPPPEPEPQHLVVEYHPEENGTGHTTEDLVGAYVVASFADRQ